MSEAKVMAQPQATAPKTAVSPAWQDENWIVIGKIRKTVGLQGWLRVGILTDFPERFKPGKKVFIQKNSGDPEKFTIGAWREHFTGTALDLKIVGVDNCEDAQAFVNAMIVLPKADREKLRSDSEFYPDELEGMQVISPEGGVVGKVLRLESELPSPYVLIQTDDSREVMIPFRKVFISSIDRKTRTVRLVEPLSFHILAK